MSGWPGRVAKAVEEGVLFVTPEEWKALGELLDTPEGVSFSGTGFEVHLNGLPVMIDASQAQRQAEASVRCLCVEFETVTLGREPQTIRSSRLCPLHGPDSAHQRIIEARRRLAADVKAEALARLRPET